MLVHRLGTATMTVVQLRIETERRSNLPRFAEGLQVTAVPLPAVIFL